MGYVTGQFNDSFPPLMDGVALIIWNYVKWLNKNFGTCYAVVPRFPASAGNGDEVAGGPVLRYSSVPLMFRSPYRIGLPWVDAPFMTKLHKLDLDLVHSHNPFSAGLIASRYARKRHVPLVATFHSSIHQFVDGLLHSRRATQFILSKVVDYYESADQVWVSSPYTRDVLKAYGYHGEPEIIPHGTDFAPPGDPEVAAAAGDKFLGTSISDNVLLYVGYLSREKNLEFLLRALAQVKKKGIPFKMVFIGEGYARHELEALTRDLHLAAETRFLGVVRNRERLGNCYARANLFLFPSVNDTYSMVIREAAVFATPSVVLEKTTVADVITRGENGFVTERRIDAYAEEISFLLTHPEEVDKAGRGGFRTLYLPWDAIMARIAQRYAQLISHARA